MFIFIVIRILLCKHLKSFKSSKIMQKRVTFSLDDKVYASFQDFCGENDIIISKRIERLMKEHLKKEGKR